MSRHTNECRHTNIHWRIDPTQPWIGASVEVCNECGMSRWHWEQGESPWMLVDLSGFKNMSEMQKTTLLTADTVKRRMRKLRIAEIDETKRHVEALRGIRLAVVGLQRRCPHPKTTIHSAQYERCTEDCDLCGAEVG
jgi:hypothetical protein